MYFAKIDADNQLFVDQGLEQDLGGSPGPNLDIFEYKSWKERFEKKNDKKAKGKTKPFKKRVGCVKADLYLGIKSLQLLWEIFL